MHPDTRAPRTLHRSVVVAWMFLAAGGFFFPGSGAAEPRAVFLKEELESARVIAVADILAYDADGLRFQPFREAAQPIRSAPLEPLTAKYSDDPAWRPMPLTEEEWGAHLGEHGMTGVWPPVGARVLIVVDARGVVSLFAWQLDDVYRVWSPHETGSVARFACEPPAERLVQMKDLEPGAAGLTSWDGCGLPIAAVSPRGIGQE